MLPLALPAWPPSPRPARRGHLARIVLRAAPILLGAFATAARAEGISLVPTSPAGLEGCSLAGAFVEESEQDAPRQVYQLPYDVRVRRDARGLPIAQAFAFRTHEGTRLRLQVLLELVTPESLVRCVERTYPGTETSMLRASGIVADFFSGLPGISSAVAGDGGAFSLLRREKWVAVTLEGADLANALRESARSGTMPLAGNVRWTVNTTSQEPGESPRTLPLTTPLALTDPDSIALRNVLLAALEAR